MCLWEQMGRPPRVNLIELGPGRGTLMADLLRVRHTTTLPPPLPLPLPFLPSTFNSRLHPPMQGTCKFGEFSAAVEVHLVEVSPTLRGIQKDNLKVSETPSGTSCTGLSGASVSWHLDLEDVPRGGEEGEICMSMTCDYVAL